MFIKDRPSHNHHLQYGLRRWCWCRRCHLSRFRGPPRCRGVALGKADWLPCCQSCYSERTPITVGRREQLWGIDTYPQLIQMYIYILYMDVRWCKIMNDLMIYPGAKWEVDNFNLRLPQQTWWCSTSPIGNHASMFRFHPDEFNGWKRHIIWHWWIGFCRVTVANSHRISGQGFIWFICHWLLQGPPHYVRQPV